MEKTIGGKISEQDMVDSYKEEFANGVPKGPSKIDADRISKEIKIRREGFKEGEKYGQEVCSERVILQQIGEHIDLGVLYLRKLLSLRSPKIYSSPEEDAYIILGKLYQCRKIWDYTEYKGGWRK